jgi:hypothetical protein
VPTNGALEAGNSASIIFKHYRHPLRGWNALLRGINYSLEENILYQGIKNLDAFALSFGRASLTRKELKK